MKKVVGLWIDYKKAVIFSLANEGAQLKRIPSERFSGEGQDRQDQYYDEVLSCIRDAESILIFGPGEAKLELRKRLEKLKLHNRIVGIETADTMTDNQIVVKIRQRFLK
ncbi:MAG: hypothetical protein WBD36_04325 [Bacteroidota bacterium]